MAPRGFAGNYHLWPTAIITCSQQTKRQFSANWVLSHRNCESLTFRRRFGGGTGPGFWGWSGVFGGSVTVGATLLTSRAQTGSLRMEGSKTPGVFVFFHHIIVSPGVTGAGKVQTGIRPITSMLTQPDDGRSSMSLEAGNRGSLRGFGKKRGKKQWAALLFAGQIRGNVAAVFPHAPNHARCRAVQLETRLMLFERFAETKAKYTLMQPAANRHFHLARQRREMPRCRKKVLWAT